LPSSHTFEELLTRGRGWRSNVREPSFPEWLLLGCRHVGISVEGAWDEDGKGVSIWDTFAHTPGKIKNDDNGDVANDHYHRYEEGVALMKSIGATAYRFSVAWPRIFPDGTGQPNPKGVDFYNRLVDALLEAGIEPFATLYHWDLPQTLQDRYDGGRSAETAKAFADYAGYVSGQLADRVNHYFTINEFRSFVEAGYQVVDVKVGGKTIQLGGAPGMRLSDSELKQVRHHSVLGHGLAVQAIRAHAPAGTKVGFAENIRVAIPVLDSPEYVEAAEKATRERNAGFTTVMLEGRYTDEYLAEAGGGSPTFADEELATIGSPLDFVGINVYRPGWYVEPSEEPPGYREIPINASHPKIAVGLARPGPGGHVLGAAPDAVDLGRHLDLRHRERLRSIRRHRRRRQGVRHRPRHVPARLPRTAPARDVGGSTGGRLLPLERPGQLRMGRRVRQPLRSRLRRLRNTRADAETQRRMVPRGGTAERRRLM
jgi:beta-glucosidase